MIKPSMVCLGKRDHELARILVGHADLDPGFNESLRAHEGHELEEEIWLRLEQIWGLLLDRSLKLFRIRGGYAVPRLGHAPMH